MTSILWSRRSLQGLLQQSQAITGQLRIIRVAHSLTRHFLVERYYVTFALCVAAAESGDMSAKQATVDDVNSDAVFLANRLSI